MHTSTTKKALAVRVSRCTDERLIRNILTHPGLYRGSVPAEQYVPPKGIYLLAGGFGGVMFERITTSPGEDEEYRAHLILLPGSFGGVSREIGRQSIAWMWRNTKARRITGEIEGHRRLAIKLATDCGLTRRDDGLLEIIRPS